MFNIVFNGLQWSQMVLIGVKTRAETAQTMANSEGHKKSSEIHEKIMRKPQESFKKKIHKRVMRKS